MHIGGDAPFVYLPDTVFKQIYTAPTLLNYGFNMDASLHPQKMCIRDRKKTYFIKSIIGWCVFMRLCRKAKTALPVNEQMCIRDRALTEKQENRNIFKLAAFISKAHRQKIPGLTSGSRTTGAQKNVCLPMRCLLYTSRCV